MARGVFVDLKVGSVIKVADAASGLDPAYSPGIAFVPDDLAMIGDLWDQITGFTYKNAAPSNAQVLAKLLDLQTQLNAVIAFVSRV